MEQHHTRATTAGNERLEFFSGSLIVSFGVNEFKAPKNIRSDLPAGLKVVVLLSGHLDIRIGDASGRQISGPCVLVIRALEDVRRSSTFAADVPVRYALVQIDPSLLDSALISALASGGNCESLSEDIGHAMFARPADRTLQSLAMQVINCPIRTAERELFVCGKALQLAAVAIGQCLQDEAAPSPRRLSPDEIAQIHAARDALLQSLKKPLSIQKLAALSGMNAGKLNAGFRRVFGTTPHKFLQEQRLAQAYRLISSGEMSVSQAAYHVGYNAAHFATLFRTRFGVSPSDLR